MTLIKTLLEKNLAIHKANLLRISKFMDQRATPITSKEMTDFVNSYQTLVTDFEQANKDLALFLLIAAPTTDNTGKTK